MLLPLIGCSQHWIGQEGRVVLLPLIGCSQHGIGQEGKVVLLPLIDCSQHGIGQEGRVVLLPFSPELSSNHRPWHQEYRKAHMVPYEVSVFF